MAQLKKLFNYIVRAIPTIFLTSIGISVIALVICMACLSSSYSSWTGQCFRMNGHVYQVKATGQHSFYLYGYDVDDTILPFEEKESMIRIDCPETFLPK